MRSNDEFGELARTFNALAAHVASLRGERDAAIRERTDVLRSFVPAAAVSPNGATTIHPEERYPAATVVAARIHGLEPGLDASEALTIGRGLIAAFDDAAHDQGLDPVQASAEDYLAVAGLGSGRLDHVVRAAEFALEMQRIAQRMGAVHGGGLRLSIGIDTGAVAGGLAGHGRLRYLLVGAPLNAARPRQPLPSLERSS